MKESRKRNGKQSEGLQTGDMPSERTEHDPKTIFDGNGAGRNVLQAVVS